MPQGMCRSDGSEERTLNRRGRRGRRKAKGRGCLCKGGSSVDGKGKRFGGGFLWEAKRQAVSRLPGDEATGRAALRLELFFFERNVSNSPSAGTGLQYWASIWAYTQIWYTEHVQNPMFLCCCQRNVLLRLVTGEDLSRKKFLKNNMKFILSHPNI